MYLDTWQYGNEKGTLRGGGNANRNHPVFCTSLGMSPCNVWKPALLTKPLLNNATYSGQAALPERWNKTIHSRRNFEVVSSGIPAGSCRLCLDDFDHMPDLSHLPKRASLFWPMNINKLCWIAEGKPSGWLAVGIPAGLALPRPLNSSQLQGKSVETCGDSLHAIL